VAGVIRARGTRGPRRPSFDARSEPRPLYPTGGDNRPNKSVSTVVAEMISPTRQAPTIKQWSLDAPREIISASHLEVKTRHTDA